MAPAVQTTQVHRALERFPNWAVPPPARMADLHLGGLQKSQIIAAVTELGIADALTSTEGQTAQQLATALGIKSADKLFRLLSAAASYGVFTPRQGRKDGVVTFHNNALSAVLCEDHPNSVKHFIKGQQFLAVPFGYLAEGLRQDRPPFELAHNKNVWQYLNERPELEHEFSMAMAAQEKLGVEAVLTDFNWSRYSRVIDVGGAYGTLVAAIMQQNSAVSGVVCDLPAVVKKAEQHWQSQYNESMLQRSSFVACDFLQAGKLPKTQGVHEAYVLRAIVHDWSDEKAIIILKNLRKAIGGDSTAVVLLVESTLQGIIADVDISIKYLFDITMMVAADGRERSEQELGGLLQQTGFQVKRVHHTRGFYKVIEAVPV